MSNKRKPLIHYEREIIEVRLRGKWKHRAIARYLKRDHRVVSKEIKRNSKPNEAYMADYAQERADRLKRKTNKCKLDKDEELYEYVAGELKEGRSPEQVAGRLKRYPPPHLTGKRISHESIYDYIYNGNGKHFYHYLRKKKAPKRKKRRSRKKHEECPIIERIPIHERPEAVDERSRIGDWESDSVRFGIKRAGLSVQYERASMMTRIHKIENKSAKETHEAIRASIESLPLDLWKTMTFDNGKEGMCHKKIRDDYNIQTYFCDAYKSWQKGGVENIIGLVREYLPKKTKIDTITPKDVYIVQELLNNRPRKKLSYLTPNEVIKREINLSGGA